MREPVVPQLSADEYLSWEARQPDRYELHEGFVVAFAGGLFAHDRVAFNVRSILERTFPEPCRSFGSDVKIKVSERFFFYADAGLVCEGYHDAAAFIERPRIVAEVLSASTRAYDQIEKRAAYRTLPSLDAYLIAHTNSRRLEIDERRDGTWQTRVVDDGSATFLDRIVALDDIYERTEIGTR